MIKVNRLNNDEFYVNADLIEFVEAAPDTVIALRSGRRIVVLQSVDEIINEIIQFRRDVYINLPRVVADAEKDTPKLEG